MVGAAYNDPIFTNDLLVNNRVTSLTPNESLYLFRVMASHLLEFCCLLENAQSYASVAAFLERLPKAARSYISDLLSLLDRNNDSKAAVAAQRNKVTFHYEKPKSVRLREALASAALHADQWTYASSQAKSRFEFSDEILTQLIVPNDQRSFAEKVKELMQLLGPLGIAAIRLSEEILRSFEPVATTGD